MIDKKSTHFKAGFFLSYICGRLGHSLGLWPILFYYVLAAVIIAIWTYMEGSTSILMYSILLGVIPIGLMLYKPHIWLRIPTEKDLEDWGSDLNSDQ